MKQDNQTHVLKEKILKELIEIFDTDREKRSLEDRDDIKLLAGTLGAVGRIIATDRVADATQLTIVKELTNDEKTRAEYIKATLPQYCPKINIDK